MALIKEFETPQGVTATYHKITKAEILIASNVIEIWIAVYASAAARDAGKGQLWTEYVTIPFAALTQDPRSLLYPLIAAFGNSYLRGGVLDSEGSEAPGDFTINLRPEAMLEPTPVPLPVVEPVAIPAFMVPPSLRQALEP